MKCLYIFLTLLFLVCNVFSQVKKQQPNILWIVTDDHRADAISAVNEAILGTKESKLGYVSSPNLDQLAKEGVLFTNAYCNSPACAPSRSSMMTGQYPHHNGVYGFELAHNQVSFQKPMVPQIVSKHGYQTSIYGKFGYRILSWNEKKSKPSFHSPKYYDHELSFKHDLKLKGFTDFNKGSDYNKGQPPVNYESYNFSNIEITKVYPEKTDKKSKKALATLDNKLDLLRAHTRKSSTMVIGGVSPRPAFETLDGFILKEFKSYLGHPNKEFKTLSGRSIVGPKTAKPQFISLNFHLPHTPVLPPKKFRNQFKDKVYKIPTFHKTEEHKTLPPQLKKLYNHMQIDGLSEAEKQQAIQDYYAYCAYGDALIGKAVKEFKKYSTDNNQEYLIIVTIGDHGWHLGEQGIEAKFAPYNTSNLGAMLLVSSDKSIIPPSMVNKDYVEYVDIVPTILRSAMVDIFQEEFDYLDGFPMQDIISNTIPKREYVLGEMNHVYGPRAYIRNKDFAFSMRVREFNGKPNAKFPPNINIKWAKTASLEKVEVALFDLRKDPEEKNNVALNEKYVALSEWFRNKLTNIVLGDGRVEVNWNKKNSYKISKFALGSDDKKINIPRKILPN